MQLLEREVQTSINKVVPSCDDHSQFVDDVDGQSPANEPYKLDVISLPLTYARVHYYCTVLVAFVLLIVSVWRPRRPHRHWRGLGMGC